jgi:Fe-S cluster assembly ATP-binding protein
MILSIKNLQAAVGDQAILKGINLDINPGEVHVIMGPNGSGKSTLASVLAGKEDFTVTVGQIEFMGHDLVAMPIEERAQQGLFLAYQYPVEIPGVNNLYFLKAAVNSVRRARGDEEYDAADFMSLVKQKLKDVDMDEKFLQRSVNEGFSGGEKKRNEILQMLLLEPKLAILDETDSGLDIDALKSVAKGINLFRRADRSILMVTHYQRLLHYVKPDYVHVLAHGKIIESGDYHLAEKLEAQGYGWLLEAL